MFALCTLIALAIITVSVYIALCAISEEEKEVSEPTDDILAELIKLTIEGAGEKTKKRAGFIRCSQLHVRIPFASPKPGYKVHSEI